jgi:hypothetical protein
MDARKQPPFAPLQGRSGAPGSGIRGSRCSRPLTCTSLGELTTEDRTTAFKGRKSHLNVTNSKADSLCEGGSCCGAHSFQPPLNDVANSIISRKVAHSGRLLDRRIKPKLSAAGIPYHVDPLCGH